MKQYRKWFLMFGFLFIILLVVPTLLHAQIDPSDPTGDPDAPLDGGLGFLLAAGVGYGVKRFRSAKNKINSF